MTRKEVVEHLQKVEDQFPVHEWVVEGIHIWPLIKIQAFFIWFNGTQKKQNKKTGGKMSLLKTYVSSFLAWIKFYLHRPPQVRYIFSGAQSHRVIHKESEYNRYFDPIMDYLDDKGQWTLLIEQGKIRTGKRYYKSERIIEVVGLFPFARIMAKLTTPAFDISTNRDVMACLEKIASGISETSAPILKRKVNAQLKTIFVWTLVFDRVFAICKPDYVFCLCYYSAMMYGMNVSAHRRGITSIDVQHGTQGPLHVGYNNFSKVPTTGYEVLPKVFWCWDFNSARQIEGWTAKQQFHQVIVGGNPWLTLWKQDSGTKSSKVLYTLQPLEPLLPGLIVEAVKRTHRIYDWHLRMHPRQEPDSEKIRGFLSGCGVLDIVTLTDSHVDPLPKAINESFAHVSRFSGAIIESSQMGIPSVTIDEIGAQAFATEIENGEVQAFLNEDVDGFIELLASLSQADRRSGIVAFEPVLNRFFL